MDSCVLLIFTTRPKQKKQTNAQTSKQNDSAFRAKLHTRIRARSRSEFHTRLRASETHWKLLSIRASPPGAHIYVRNPSMGEQCPPCSRSPCLPHSALFGLWSRGFPNYVGIQKALRRCEQGARHSSQRSVSRFPSLFLQCR